MTDDNVNRSWGNAMERDLTALRPRVWKLEQAPPEERHKSLTLGDLFEVCEKLAEDVRLLKFPPEAAPERATRPLLTRCPRRRSRGSVFT